MTPNTERRRATKRIHAHSTDRARKRGSKKTREKQSAASPATPARREMPKPAERQSVHGAHGHIEGQTAWGRSRPMADSGKPPNPGRVATPSLACCSPSCCCQRLGGAQNQQAEQWPASRRGLRPLVPRARTAARRSRVPRSSNADERRAREGHWLTPACQPVANPQHGSARDAPDRVRDARPHHDDGLCLRPLRGHAGSRAERFPMPAPRLTAANSSLFR